MSDFVFHRRGCKIGDFEKSWKNATEKAHLEGRLFHDLRRSAIRNMRRAGVPEEICMKISGHRTSSTFRRYNITDEADLKRAVQMTQDYLSKLPAERTEQLDDENFENQHSSSIESGFVAPEAKPWVN